MSKEIISVRLEQIGFPEDWNSEKKLAEILLDTSDAFLIVKSGDQIDINYSGKVKTFNVVSEDDKIVVIGPSGERYSTEEDDYLDEYFYYYPPKYQEE
jgi:hypothetical protein